LEGRRPCLTIAREQDGYGEIKDSPPVFSYSIDLLFVRAVRRVMAKLAADGKVEIIKKAFNGKRKSYFYSLKKKSK
jgi:hypothetical protein